MIYYYNIKYKYKYNQIIFFINLFKEHISLIFDVINKSYFSILKHFSKLS